MTRPAQSLRLVTVPLSGVIDTIGRDAASSAERYVQALADKGYVPVPIPWEDGPISSEGDTDLLILSRDESPIPPPGRALLRAIAFMENAFHIGRIIGEPGKAQKERIVDIADGLEKLTPTERSILGAHYHHVLNNRASRPRPLALKTHDEHARDRIIRSLYACVTADGTLYDVILERMEEVLDREGLNGRRTMAGIVPARQIVLRHARAEHDPARWIGLNREHALLMSWIAARPRANIADLEGRARQLGLDPHEALIGIKGWIDDNRMLTGVDSVALPTPGQRP